MIRLPGVCIVCRRPVTWTGKRWQDAPVGRGTGVPHVCPEERPRCGVWMRYLGEPCARLPGHRWDHRSEYAMENARRWRMGFEA